MGSPDEQVVTCELTIPVHGQQTRVPAYIVDLSRIGARIILVVPDLGLPADASLEKVDDTLQRLFTTGVEATLSVSPQGSTFLRRLHAVHFEHQEGDVRTVELLCVFGDPLGPTEAGALGLPDAAEGDDVATVPMRATHDRGVAAKRRAAGAVWSIELIRAAGQTGPWADGAPIRVRAAAEEHPELVTFDGFVEALDPAGVDIIVPDRSVLGLEEGVQDVHVLASAFVETYGQTFVLGLRARARGQWTTRAELESVGIPEGEAGALRLGYSFSRRMRPDDVRRLHGNA